MEDKNVFGVKISLIILTIIFVVLVVSFLPMNFCKFITWIGCCEDTIR